MARGRKLEVVGELGMAICGTSHDAGGAIFKDEVLTFGNALGNGEDNFGCHRDWIHVVWPVNLCLRIMTGAMFVN
jgi:hypothetical protein